MDCGGSQLMGAHPSRWRGRRGCIPTGNLSPGGLSRIRLTQIGHKHLESAGAQCARQGGISDQTHLVNARREFAQLLARRQKDSLLIRSVGGTEIWVCDNEGQTQIQLTKFGGYAGSPSWSPDGKEIALDARPEGSGDIYIVSAEGGSPRRLTSEPSAERRPLWSKDGRWIYFVSDRTGDWQIWKMPAVGGAAMQVTKDGGNGPLLAVDQFIYYTKSSYVSPKKQNEPGVWRVPLRAETRYACLIKVPRTLSHMTAEGIGFFNSRSTPNPTIDFYRFATAQVTNLLSIEKSKSGGGGGILSVSPDGQWLIYVETDQIENDIMLVENFR